MRILDLDYDSLCDYLVSIGDKKFRAKQIYDWIYKKRVLSFLEMSNIKKEMREKLESDLQFEQLELIEKYESSDGTVKFLFRLEDNNIIETVLMRHDYGNSVCITSQVGCNMGCKFCASGKLKKLRDLRPGEMVMQVLYVQQYLDTEESRLSHVVVMGIGEPFENYDSFMKFIRIINSDLGLAIGQRHITVSTCGLVKRIIDFANEGTQVNLAISLHAPNDEIRNKIMPISTVHSLNEVIEAIKYYIDKTNRRVTIEYILLNGMNDSVRDAHQLAKLLRGLNVYVNLIPYNSVEEEDFKRTDSDNKMKFYDILKKERINVTIRREKGHDIDAACGQLRAKLEKQKR